MTSKTTWGWGLLCLSAWACGTKALGDCPSTHVLDGDQVCRQRCLNAGDCFAHETCSSALYCVPKTDQGPEITLLRATPNPVELGGNIRVDYVALFADGVQLTALKSTGADPFYRSDALAESLDYGPINADLSLELTASRGEVKVSQRLEIKVQVVERVQILSFTADHLQVRAGDRVVLNWEVIHGDGGISVKTKDGIVVEDILGQQAVVNPQATTTYQLSATGPGGPATAEVTVEVVVDPAELSIDEFRASAPSAAKPDDNAVLRWRTTGASTLTLADKVDGRVLYETSDIATAAAGAWLVTLPDGQAQARYVLSVEGQGDTAQQEVAINITPWAVAPTLSGVTVTPEVDRDRSPHVISWNVTPPDARVEIVDLAFGTFSLGIGNSSMVPYEGVTRRFIVQAKNEAGIAAVEVVSWTTQDEREPNDSMPIPSDDQVIVGQLGSLNGTDDVDQFSAQLVNGGSLRVAFWNTSCTAPIEVIVADPQGGSTRASGNGFGDCPGDLFLTGTQAGQYVVELSSPLLSLPEDYTLVIDARGPLCGNGVVEGNEACDPEQPFELDGCTHQCQLDPRFEYDVATEPALTIAPNALPIEFNMMPPVPGTDVADQGVAVIELPFEFPFYGHRYRGLMLHTDGFIGFVPALATEGVLGPGAPNGVVALFNGDLQLRGIAAGMTASRFLLQGQSAVSLNYSGLTLSGAPTSELSGNIVLAGDGRLVLNYRSLMRAANRLVDAGLQDPTGARVVLAPCDSGTPGMSGCPVGGLPDGKLVSFTPGMLGPN